MYRKILIALDNGPADKGLLPHVTELATHFGSELLLLHVADGWAARSFDQLKLAESEEMKADREYLEAIAGGLRMTSHGHRFFGDLFHGSTITQVRHNTTIPLLIVRTKKV